MIPVCRACARSTDRVWVGIPGRPGVAMCHECQKDWAESGEKERADKYAAVAEQGLSGAEAQKNVVLAGIVERALVDFLFRKQQERTARGRVVGP